MIWSVLLMVSAAQTASLACPPQDERTQRHRFNQFVDELLIDRDPRRAFETFAAPNLMQHNPAFGKDRASTIKQYQWMVEKPGSRFVIDGVATEGDIGTIRFRGKLDAKMPGARVVAFFRISCGRIVEAWDSFALVE